MRVDGRTTCGFSVAGVMRSISRISGSAPSAGHFLLSLSTAMSEDDRSIELERHLREACNELRDRLRGGEECRAEVMFARHAQLAEDAEAALEVLYTEYVTREELGQ